MLVNNAALVSETLFSPTGRVRTLDTSDADMSGADTTSTIIGGTDVNAVIPGAVPLAAKACDAYRAAARLVAISILRLIDGCDRQKFDVRNRDERTC